MGRLLRFERAAGMDESDEEVANDTTSERSKKPMAFDRARIRPRRDIERLELLCIIIKLYSTVSVSVWEDVRLRF